MPRPKQPKWWNDNDEGVFQEWYKGHAKKLKLNPNPDDPKHQYNYRDAFREGTGPDKSGHWPSKHKLPKHPRLVVDGINTKTGKRVRRK